MTEYIIVKKPKRRRFRREESSEDTISFEEMLRRRKEEFEALEKFMKEQDKANKSKYEPKGGRMFTFAEGMLLAFMFQYVFGPSLHAVLKSQGLQ